MPEPTLFDLTGKVAIVTGAPRHRPRHRGALATRCKRSRLLPQAGAVPEW